MLGVNFVRSEVKVWLNKNYIWQQLISYRKNLWQEIDGYAGKTGELSGEGKNLIFSSSFGSPDKKIPAFSKVSCSCEVIWKKITLITIWILSLTNRLVDIKANVNEYTQRKFERVRVQSWLRVQPVWVWNLFIA